MTQLLSRKLDLKPSGVAACARFEPILGPRCSQGVE